MGKDKVKIEKWRDQNGLAIGDTVKVKAGSWKFGCSRSGKIGIIVNSNYDPLEFGPIYSVDFGDKAKKQWGRKHARNLYYADRLILLKES